MKGGVLEVLVVSAEGIKQTNLLGTPAYYVLLQCGNQTHKSKTSPANEEEVWWNEKFFFRFPCSDWKSLTYLQIKILDTEMFGHSGFVGKTRIHLDGIITEGTARGFIELEPAPHVVVLEDDTYKGKVMIGIKFISNVEVYLEDKHTVKLEKEPKRPSMCRVFFDFWKMSLQRLLLRINQTNCSKSKLKKT